LPPPLGIPHRVPHLPRARIYRPRYFFLRGCRFQCRALGLPHRPRARPRADYHGAPRRGDPVPRLRTSFLGFRPASLPTATTCDRGRFSLIATIRQEVLGVNDPCHARPFLERVRMQPECVGPTTPTRAGRLFDASVDPTEARNALVISQPIGVDGGTAQV